MEFTRDPSRINTVSKDSSFESTNKSLMDKKPAYQSAHMPEDGLTEEQIDWLLRPSSTDDT